MTTGLKSSIVILCLFHSVTHVSHNLFAANSYTRVVKFASEVTGPEDFEVDLTSHEAPRLLISAYDRRKERNGRIYSIPFTDDGPGHATVLVDKVHGCPLRPHGISLVRSETDGFTRLYVINHLKRDDEKGSCWIPRSVKGKQLLHSVDVFRIEGKGPDGLKHEESLTDEILTSPNDIVALSDGQIYLTNEIAFRGMMLKLMEFLKLKRISNVVHFTGFTWRRVVRGLRYANGIAVHNDRLYVSASLDKTIDVYRRDPETGDIKERIDRIRIGSGTDNLLWGSNGEGASESRNLYTAAHPSWRKFIGHAKDPDRPSPSEIYRIITTFKDFHDSDQYVEKILGVNIYSITSFASSGVHVTFTILV